MAIGNEVKEVDSEVMCCDTVALNDSLGANCNERPVDPQQDSTTTKSG